CALFLCAFLCARSLTPSRAGTEGSETGGAVRRMVRAGMAYLRTLPLLAFALSLFLAPGCAPADEDPQDAGSDAGSDAGQNDAGETDAGSQDAGGQDAGES